MSLAVKLASHPLFITGGIIFFNKKIILNINLIYDRCKRRIKVAFKTTYEICFLIKPVKLCLES
jgi:hypothetical protein